MTLYGPDVTSPNHVLVITGPRPGGGWPLGQHDPAPADIRNVCVKIHGKLTGKRSTPLSRNVLLDWLVSVGGVVRLSRGAEWFDLYYHTFPRSIFPISR